MKITQVELDDLCGFTDGYIGRLERGERNATIGTISRVARALRLKPSWLLDKAGL